MAARNCKINMPKITVFQTKAEDADATCSTSKSSGVHSYRCPDNPGALCLLIQVEQISRALLELNIK